MKALVLEDYMNFSFRDYPDPRLRPMTSHRQGTAASIMGPCPRHGIIDGSSIPP